MLMRIIAIQSVGSCPEMKLYGVNDPPPAGVGVPLSSGEEKLACAALLGLDPGKLYAYSSRGAYMELQAPVDGSPTPGTRRGPNAGRQTPRTEREVYTCRITLKSRQAAASHPQPENTGPLQDNSWRKIKCSECFYHEEGDGIHASSDALLYFCTELRCVEISPDDKELTLAEGSFLSLTCSGSGETTWEFKSVDVPYCQVEQFQNDPKVWFIERSHGMVTKNSEESTVPCVVSNPDINVTLYERDTDQPIRGLYVPSEGYKAPLEERTYVCRGEMNGEVMESQAFYVFSVTIPEAIDIYINASNTVLKQGEPLTVNCTVQGMEIADFSWDRPNSEDVEPLTDVLPNTNMRSCLIFPHAMVANSGNYVCHVHEPVLDQTASASVNITVLERGFVDVKAAQKQNISARLQENVQLRVDIEAYPPPQVRWSKDGATIKGHKPITTRQEHEIRYVTILTLVRVRTEQKGLYSVLVTNGDDTKEVTFDLEIKYLTDHHLPGKKHLVTCVAEGVPVPSIQWYSCDSMHKCSNQTEVWQPLIAEPEVVSIRTNVSYSDTRKTSQVRSQVTFHKPQQVTVRCETSNRAGLLDRRDVNWCPNTALYSQVAVLAAVLALVVIIIISIIILVAVWRKYCRYGDLVDYLHRNKHSLLQNYAEKNQDESCLISGGSTPLSQRKGESDGGYMDMSKDEPSIYMPMQEHMDTIKYADIQPSPYESPYQHDIYQEQGGSRLDLFISDSSALTYDDLLGFSYQVAKGMEFLASKNKYNQVNDSFLKSDHPAVTRTKPRLSSPFPIANPAFGSPPPHYVPPDPYTQSPSPGEFREEADTQEVVTAYNEYIIPIPDPKPDDVFTDVTSESPASSLALEEEADSMSQDTADTLPEEDRPEDTSERDALLGCSGTPEVEDSFL
ncbi:hypothetical protein F7725_010024 [Dissostichus mawsoni]|uniref:Ig-like domain-containing protein n=1 Tax=Dissostichus mawsoni TaxID=36200 RepID=A0A7J5XMC8_DISMA|nr:hypothetical protein F7725_010024 [Dissostichus mawsoni]